MLKKLSISSIECVV